MVNDFIDHLKHPMAYLLRDLMEREYRVAKQLMIIDDEDCIVEAFKANVRISDIIYTDVCPESILKLSNSNISMWQLSPRTGKKIFGGEKRSRLLAIAHVPFKEAFKPLRSLKKDFLILDQLKITGNIGAIIRSSKAFNIGALILVGVQPIDLYDRRIIRASRGLVFSVPIYCLSIEEWQQLANEIDHEILFTASNQKKDVDVLLDSKKNYAVIMGSEKDGCDKLLKSTAKYGISIPMSSTVESLNVSVASSLIMYHLFKKNNVQ